jgi:hypothetical protein
MHIEFLVEELSAKAALERLIPRIAAAVSFSVHVHRNKQDLLKKVPDRLRGYKHWIPSDWRIVVLVDADDDDCHVLKQSLENTARAEGFSTRTQRAQDATFTVLNRIAIEELEAWFFGDLEAVRAAFPRVPQDTEHKKSYRYPDAVKGGTWEALEKLLRKHGYYPEGYAKIDAATRISEHMDPERNRSHSFCCFRDGIKELVGVPTSEGPQFKLFYA